MRWDYSKFENDNSTLQWTNPFFGGNQLDTTYLAPDNTFNKFTVSGNYRDLPWRQRDLGALHVGEDDERRAARADRAQLRRRLQRHAARREQLQRREHQPVVPAGLDGHTRRQLGNARLLLLDEAAEQFRRDHVRKRAGDAAREQPRLRQLRGPGTAFRRRPSATARTSSSTTRRTTSASTPGGGSRAASALASAGTTTTSTRRASTTTRRTGTSCGPSTRTRCSTRCPAA